MIVYYSMYAFCFITAYVVRHMRTERTREQREKIIGWICFSILTILLALRHQSMGIDLRPNAGYGYLGMYETIGRASWTTIFNNSFLNYEKGYVVLNKVLNYISRDRQFLLVACSVLSVIPVGYLVVKRSRSPLFSFIVYMGLPLIQLLYSGLRQDLAIGLCALSILFIERKQPLKFIIIVFFASTLHATSLLFIIAYPAYHYIKVKKKTRVLSVAAIPLIYIVRRPLFSFFSSFYKADVQITDTGAFRLLIVFVGLYVFCSYFSDDSQEQIGLLNIFYFACIFQCFAGVNTLVMRVGLYFMVPLIILLPNVVMSMENRNNYRISRDIFCIFFVCYGLYVLHTPSYALSYPYYFFWETLA